jgi:hypothetical protein
MSGGFLQLINQWSNFWSTRVRYKQPSDGQRGFFKLLELTPQLLAVFTKLLQRFITIDKVTIRGDPKLHVHITLMGQQLIIILKYLAGILLSVEEILHIRFGCLEDHVWFEDRWMVASLCDE